MRPFAQYPLGHRATAGVVSLSNEILTVDVTSPSVANTDINYNTDRTVTSSGAPLSIVGDHWLSAGGLSSNYDIRVTPTSGTMSSGSATSTWLNLGSNRSWTVSKVSAGNKVCTATVEIRDAVSLTVLASCTITLTAHVEAA